MDPVNIVGNLCGKRLLESATNVTHLTLIQEPPPIQFSILGKASSEPFISTFGNIPFPHLQGLDL